MSHSMPALYASRTASNLKRQYSAVDNEPDLYVPRAASNLKRKHDTVDDEPALGRPFSVVVSQTTMQESCA